MARLLGMGPLVVASLLAAGRVPPWLRSSERPSHFVVPALQAEIAVLSALGTHPLFNLRTSHFLRSTDFVRGQLRGRSRLCVATLRECMHWSLGRVD